MMRLDEGGGCEGQSWGRLRDIREVELTGFSGYMVRAEGVGRVEDGTARCAIQACHPGVQPRYATQVCGPGVQTRCVAQVCSLCVLVGTLFLRRSTQGRGKQPTQHPG